MGRVQIQVLLLCTFILVLDGLDTQVIGYLGPALAEDWHLSSAALSPIFSAGLAGLLAGLLVIAPIADRVGRKLTLAVSTLLFGAFTLATAGAQGVSDLMLYRVAAGIGLGAALPNALNLASEYCPKRRRATLVMFVFCGFAIGSILGGGLTAGLVARFGWRLVFVVGGILPLLATPFLFWMPESLSFLALRQPGSPRLVQLVQRIDPGYPVPPGAQITSLEGWPTAVPVASLFTAGRALGTILLWIAFFINLMDFYFLQNWLPTIFRSSGFSLATAAWVTTLIPIGGIVAGLMAGPLMDLYGPYPILSGLYLLGTAGVAYVGLASSLPALIVTTFCAGFCVSGGQKVVNALAVGFYPTSMRATGVGWALGVGRVGSIVGPAVAGWLLARRWPNSLLFELAAAPLLLSAASIWFMGLRYREPRAALVLPREQLAGDRR